MSIGSSQLAESLTDSSFSRTYLTPLNNPYQQIHTTTNDPNVLAERRRKNELLAQKKPFAFNRKRQSHLLQIIPTKSATKFEKDSSASFLEQGTASVMVDPTTEEDIFAPPESSDEDATINKETKVALELL